MSATIIGALVIVIMGFCTALKETQLSTRWLPLVGIVIGVAGSLYFGGADWLNVLAGVVTGLSTSGLYSFYKKTIMNR